MPLKPPRSVTPGRFCFGLDDRIMLVMGGRGIVAKQV